MYNVDIHINNTFIEINLIVANYDYDKSELADTISQSYTSTCYCGCWHFACISANEKLIIVNKRVEG